MSDADKPSIDSMAARSMPGSSYIPPGSLGENQPDLYPATTEANSTGAGSSQDKMLVPKLEPDVPSTTSLQKTMLTMVLVSQDDKETYAVVPFPRSYNTAAAVAVKILGRYMSDPRPKNITLRCSIRNRKDQWVWADIPLESWKMTVGLHGPEVGVSERNILGAEYIFVHGTVSFTIGTKVAKGTKWSSELVTDFPRVERPKTFSEAVEILKVNAELADLGPQAQENFRNSNNLRFYKFPQGSLRVWTAIPLEAHSDDDLWRSGARAWAYLGSYSRIGNPRRFSCTIPLNKSAPPTIILNCCESSFCFCTHSLKVSCNRIS